MINTTSNLIFVTGKGGVGKTFFSNALASHLASLKKNTLLCRSLSLVQKPQKKESVAKNLTTIDLNPVDCFQEYIVLKLQLKPLYTAFLGNRVTQYLEKAAPGVRDMVTLGKIWHERKNYDHVIIDMPSTGFALTMLYAPIQFAQLFPGGPIYRGSHEMIETLSDPKKTSFIAVTLPEEMPVQESIDLATELKTAFPTNPPQFVFNRVETLSESEKNVLSALKKHSELDESSHQHAIGRALTYRASKANLHSQFLPQLNSKLIVPEFYELNDRLRLEKLEEYLKKQSQVRDSRA